MGKLRATLLVLSLLSLSLTALAQGPSDAPRAAVSGPVPDAPSFVMTSFANPSATLHRFDALSVVVLPVVAPAPQSSHKVLDKKFYFLTGFAVFATVADVELTQRCLHHHTCVELNPTLPLGHTAMYMANVPVTGALFYWSYRRKAKGQRLWWLPTLVDALPHAGGALDNTRFK